MATSGGPVATPSAYSVLPSAQAVGASPYVYQNANAYAEDVLVAGGTVTALDFSRDGITWHATGLIVGVIRLSPGDRLRTTYTVVPAITRILR